MGLVAHYGITPKAPASADPRYHLHFGISCTRLVCLAKRVIKLRHWIPVLSTPHKDKNIPFSNILQYPTAPIQISHKDTMGGPPFRAEHVGSLLRSRELLDLWYRDQRSDEDKCCDLNRLEDQEITEAVHMQQQLGFRAITDGELRRRLHWGSFFTDLEGFEEVPVKDVGVFRPYIGVTKLFTESGPEGASIGICTGKIRHVRSSFINEFRYMKSLVELERVKDIKVTVSSLELYHLIYKQGCAYPASLYASDDEYLADLAEAFRQEVKILYSEGMRNLQIDDPNLTCEPNSMLDYTTHLLILSL